MTDSTIIVVTIIMVIIGYTPIIYKIHRRLDTVEKRLHAIEAKFQSEESAAKDMKK